MTVGDSSKHRANTRYGARLSALLCSRSFQWSGKQSQLHHPQNKFLSQN